MKVAVVSDSHDNQQAVEALLKEIADTNIVFHLGDIISPFTLKKFAGHQYYGVFGNNDGEKPLLRKIADEYEFKIDEQPFIVELLGKKFLLYHGTGSVSRTKQIIRAFAESGEYDFVLYGHTHIKDYRKIGHTVVLNPGEVCGYLTGKHTYARLDTDTGDVEFFEF